MTDEYIPPKNPPYSLPTGVDGKRLLPLNNFRFVIRGGRRILQQAHERERYSDQEQHWLWLDVPLYADESSPR